MTVRYINELEECLVAEEYSFIVQLVIEGECRISFQALASWEFNDAPDHIRALLALNAVPVSRRIIILPPNRSQNTF